MPDVNETPKVIALGPGDGALGEGVSSTPPSLEGPGAVVDAKNLETSSEVEAATQPSTSEQLESSASDETESESELSTSAHEETRASGSHDAPLDEPDDANAELSASASEDGGDDNFDDEGDVSASQDDDDDDFGDDESDVSDIEDEEDDDFGDDESEMSASSDDVATSAADETGQSASDEDDDEASASTSADDEDDNSESADDAASFASDDDVDDDSDEVDASPARIHPAPAQLALDRVDEDDSFRLREEGDVATLAMDIARLGQLFPVDVRLKPPDRYQVITGFRRVAALKFLQRERVLARLHIDLSDDDAMSLALAEAIHSQPVSREELLAFRQRLDEQGRLNSVAEEMLMKALADDDGLAPEEAPVEPSAELSSVSEEGDGEGDEEVDADELAADVTHRLGQINQDLSLLADVFAELSDERRGTLLEQLRYSSQLVAFLEGKTDE